jgi:hypothetical protein
MRKVLTVATILSVAFAAASSAQAQSPVDRIIAQEDNKGVARVASTDPSPLRPDNRPGPFGVGQGVAAQTAPSLRPDNRPGPFGIGQVEPVQIVGPGDGFDWGDAGLGAGVGIALMLLAAGGRVLRRQMTYEATPS